jgi:hypothetical protein
MLTFEPLSSRTPVMIGTLQPVAAALFAIAAVGLAALPAQAQSSRRGAGPAVQVDTRPLASLGARLEAGRLQECLPVAIGQQLAGRNAPPVLVVVRAVSIAAVAGVNGTESRLGQGGQALDQLEGDVIVNGRRVPLLVGSSPWGSIGRDPTANVLQRVDSLCATFAQWIPSRLGI